MKSASLYQDYDALAYRPHSVGEERGAINHIKKAKQKTKGLEIVFDPKGHKDFVTGFRKRKQQRRKEANKQIEKKAKKQRVEQRAERRKEMKHQLGLPEDYGIQDSDSEQDGAVAAAEDGGAAAAAAAAVKAKSEVKQYQQAGYTTTVSITNFNAGYADSSDEEPVEEEEGSDADDGEAAAMAAPSRQRQQQQSQKSLASKASTKTAPTKQGKVVKKSSSKRSRVASRE